MGSVFALLAIMGVAYLVILAASIAFELTGLDRETARFQALSAFTNCGFTTSVSEKIVRHPVRRRITMTLILLGWAGAASVIASLISSVNAFSLGSSVGHLAIVVAGGLLGWYLLRRKRIGLRLTDFLRHHLAARLEPDALNHEDLLRYAPGFGVMRVEVPDTARFSGRPLRESGLREAGVQVLLVEHVAGQVVLPSPDDVIEPKPHPPPFGSQPTACVRGPCVNLDSIPFRLVSLHGNTGWGRSIAGACLSGSSSSYGWRSSHHASPAETVDASSRWWQILWLAASRPLLRGMLRRVALVPTLLAAVVMLGGVTAA
ncbi:MAG: TrkA C-terminal domain-containing protein [bacterium]